MSCEITFLFWLPCSGYLFPLELGLISLHWFLTIFASVVHMKVLVRIWDLFFYDGSIVLFQIMIGMLKMKVCLNSTYL